MSQLFVVTVQHTIVHLHDYVAVSIHILPTDKFGLLSGTQVDQAILYRNVSEKQLSIVLDPSMMLVYPDREAAVPE